MPNKIDRWAQTLEGEYAALRDKFHLHAKAAVERLCLETGYSFSSASSTMFYVEGSQEEHDGYRSGKYYIEKDVPEFNQIMQFHEEHFGLPDLIFENGKWIT